MIRAEFKHAKIITGSQPQQVQRHADVVVFVTGGLGDAESLTENGGDHFFRRGLAGGAGNSDDAGCGGHLPAVVRCECVQCGEGVWHL